MFSFINFTLHFHSFLLLWNQIDRIETDRVRKRHLTTKYHFVLHLLFIVDCYFTSTLSEMQLFLYSDYFLSSMFSLTILYTYTNTHIYIYVKFKKHFVSYMQCAHFRKSYVLPIPIPPACKQSLEILSV